MVHAVVAGLLDPELGIAGHVFPEHLRGRGHLVVVVLVLFGIDAARLLAHRAVRPAVVVFDHRGVVAVEQFGDVVPLAEVVAFGGVGDVVGFHARPRRRRIGLVVGAVHHVGIPADAQIRGRNRVGRLDGPPRRAEVRVGVELGNRFGEKAVGSHRPAFAEHGVEGGVVEHAVQHDVDGVKVLDSARGRRVALRLVAQADEVRERGDGIGFHLLGRQPVQVLGLGHFVIHGEVVLRRVRGTRPVAVAVVIRVAAGVVQVRVDGLEPQAVDAHAVQVVDRELAEVVAVGQLLGQVLEVAGAGVAAVRGLGGQDVQLVHGLFHRLLGRDDDHVVAAQGAVGTVGVPNPVGGTRQLVAGGDAVDAALAGGQLGFPGALAEPHGNGLPVAARAVVGGDGVLVRGNHAVRPAVVIGVDVGVVAAAEVGEDFDLGAGVVGSVVGDLHGDGFALGLVDEELAGGVVGGDAVDGEVAGPVGPHAVFEGAGAVAGIVFGLFPLAVAAGSGRAPRVDFIDENRAVVEQAVVLEGDGPNHGIAGGIVVGHRALERHVRLKGQRGPGPGTAAGGAAGNGLDAGHVRGLRLIGVNAIADDDLVGPARPVGLLVADLRLDADLVVGARADDVAAVPDEARFVAVLFAGNGHLERGGLRLSLVQRALVHGRVVGVHVDEGVLETNLVDGSFGVGVDRLEVIQQVISLLGLRNLHQALPVVVVRIAVRPGHVDRRPRVAPLGMIRDLVDELVVERAAGHVHRLVLAGIDVRRLVRIAALVVPEEQVHVPAGLRRHRPAHAPVCVHVLDARHHVVRRAVPRDALRGHLDAHRLVAGIDGADFGLGRFHPVGQRLAAGHVRQRGREIDHQIRHCGVARAHHVRGNARLLHGHRLPGGPFEVVFQHATQRGYRRRRVARHARRDGHVTAVFRFRRRRAHAGEREVRRRRNRQHVVAARIVRIVVPIRPAARGVRLHADDVVQPPRAQVPQRGVVPAAVRARPVLVEFHFDLVPVARRIVEPVDQPDLEVGPRRRRRRRRPRFRVHPNRVRRRRVLLRPAVGVRRPQRPGGAAAAGPARPEVRAVVLEPVDVHQAVFAFHRHPHVPVAVRRDGFAGTVALEFRVGTARVDFDVLHLPVGRVENHQRRFVVIPFRECVDALAAAGQPLREPAAPQRPALVAQVVQPVDVSAQAGAVVGFPVREHVAPGVARLEPFVEHAFALPVAVVGVVVAAALGTVAVAVLVEAVFRAVVKQGNGRRQIEEGHRRLHDPDRVFHAVPAKLHREAVHVVVVEEGDDVLLAIAVILDGVHLLAELVAAVAVAEDAVHRLHEREEEGGVETVAVAAPAGEGPGVVAEEFAEHQKIGFPAPSGVVADSLGPVAAPVVGDVLDGVNAEAVAVGGVDEVLERAVEIVGGVRIVLVEVVGAFELAHEVFGRLVPVVDGAVDVEAREVVERGAVAVVVIPPVLS